MPPRLTTFRRLSPSLVSDSSISKNLKDCCSRNRRDVAPSFPSPFSSYFLNSFSTTSSIYYARSHEPTYYEILNVPVTATAAEIKKQFYALSLKHHPDRNRSDPEATKHFATISSAYQVLGDSTKRARYDLDHGIGAKSHNTHSSGVSGQHPMGSYSSAGSYAGSRPASGLSKRRATFRGPPPSFYAHGGYGTAGRASGSTSPGGSYTGTGTGTESNNNSTDEDPTSFINKNPIWHFNAKGHHRTQVAEDARRRQRQARQKQYERDLIQNDGGNFIVRFIVVSAILTAAAYLGGLLVRTSTTGITTGKPVQKNQESRSRRD